MRGAIYVVRHGQDEDNAADILNGRRDSPLTKLGHAQSEQVAAKLATYNIRTIYSSPLKRAQSTAQAIANTSGMGITIEPDLIERDFGSLTGKPVSDITRYSRNFIRVGRIIHFLDVEGAESMADALTRASRALSGIRRAQEYGNVVVVTHGDLGKMLRAAFYGWSWQKGLETTYIANAAILKLE